MKKQKKPTCYKMNGMLRYLLIGMMLFTGSAHAADDNFDTVKKAAEQGHADAQYNLGVMYDVGVGVLEDDIQAYAWISIAAAQGLENVKNIKEGLTGKMTRAEIAEAQKLSRKYWEDYGPGLNTQ